MLIIHIKKKNGKSNLFWFVSLFCSTLNKTFKAKIILKKYNKIAVSKINAKNLLIRLQFLLFFWKAFVIHLILVVNGGYLLYDVSHSKTASHLHGRWWTCLSIEPPCEQSCRERGLCQVVQLVRPVQLVKFRISFEKLSIWEDLCDIIRLRIKNVFKWLVSVRSEAFSLLIYSDAAKFVNV